MIRRTFFVSLVIGVIAAASVMAEAIAPVSPIPRGEKLAIFDSVIKLCCMGVTEIGPGKDGEGYISIVKDEPKPETLARYALLMAMSGEFEITVNYFDEDGNEPEEWMEVPGDLEESRELFAGKYDKGYSYFVPRETLVKAGQELLGYTLSKFPKISGTLATDKGYFVEETAYFGANSVMVRVNSFSSNMFVSAGPYYFEEDDVCRFTGTINSFSPPRDSDGSQIIDGRWLFEATVSIVNGHWRIVKLVFEEEAMG
jgi:hypothetical protein